MRLGVLGGRDMGGEGDIGLRLDGEGAEATVTRVPSRLWRRREVGAWLVLGTREEGEWGGFYSRLEAVGAVEVSERVAHGRRGGSQECSTPGESGEVEAWAHVGGVTVAVLPHWSGAGGGAEEVADCGAAWRQDGSGAALAGGGSGHTMH